MPDGWVKWYDPKDDRGVVEHNGREYAVSGGEIDNHAKRAGAPVHFDIQRADGGDIATAVELREGSRTSRSTAGVGDLSGAHHPSEKGQDEEVQTNDLSVRRRAYGEQPRLVAEDWVRLVGSGQVDRAAELYAPDATIVEGDTTFAGDDDRRRWLQHSVLHGAEPGQADISGDGADGFVVSWRTVPGSEAAVETELVVADGRIAAQETSEQR